MSVASAEGRVGVLSNVAGAVLVGGASRRMGRDKAQIDVGGQTILARTVALLARCCDEVGVVGGEAPVGGAGRSVADREDAGPRCALRGLVSALEAATAERVLAWRPTCRTCRSSCCSR